jgi:hypothetical protein
MRSTVREPREAPPMEPAEGRPDMDLPGADRPDPPPEPHPDKNDKAPERLARRIEKPSGGIAAGEPDLLPDVEVPDAPM